MKSVPRLARGATLAFLLLSIAACASSPPIPPPVEFRTVTVEVPKFVPLPAEAVAVTAEPAAPAPACFDPAGFAPVMCNGALADYADALKAWGRAGWLKVASIARLQPPGESPPAKPP